MGREYIHIPLGSRIIKIYLIAQIILVEIKNNLALRKGLMISIPARRMDNQTESEKIKAVPRQTRGMCKYVSRKTLKLSITF